MEIDSNMASSIIFNVISDMTTAHGSSTAESTQEPGMQEGEKEKTITPIDDASKSVGDEI